MGDRNIKMADFDAESMTILQWVSHVDLCMTAAGWTQARTATTAQLHLKGPPMVWLQNRIREETEGIDTWYPPEVAGVRPANLKTLLTARFHQSSTAVEQAKLRATLTQLETETVATFFDRVESVQFTLDDCLPADFRVNQKAEYDIIRSSQILQNFITGLKPEVLKHVTTLNVATATEALEAATAFEMANRKKPAGKMAGMGAKSEVEEMAAKIAAAAIDEFHRSNRGQSQRGRGGGRGRGGQRPNDTGDGCAYCGYLGHTIGVCNIKTKDVAAGIRTQRSQYYAPGRIGRGSSRGRGSGRGRGDGRGRMHEMSGQTGNPYQWGSQPTQPPQGFSWDANRAPPADPNFQQQQLQLQQQALQQQQLFEQGNGSAFRFYPENQ
jgi:hypothetical protein